MKKSLLVLIITCTLAPTPCHSEPVVVGTWNIYFGMNVFRPILNPNILTFPVRVRQTYNELLATRFKERSEAIASWIQQERPHLVGLQEVPKYFSEAPSRPFHQATHLLFDHLAMLMDSLPNYEVVASLANFNTEVPMSGHPKFPHLEDLRIQDHIVVIKRKDVDILSTQTQHYDDITKLLVFKSVRGFIHVRAEIKGRKFNFFNTHLESISKRSRVAQGQELLSWVNSRVENEPVILVGDFNAKSSESTYQNITEAGFEDVEDDSAGNTCCHASHLRNKEPKLHSRIDFVFVRGSRNEWSAHRRGDNVTHKTPSGLWPSDHVGIIAKEE